MSVIVPDKTRADRRVARTAGALFIVATLASILSTPFLGPVNSSNYLVNVAANTDQVRIGVFFVVISAFASASIAISLYPVLKSHNESLALGAVGFRLIEGALYIISAISLFSILTLSRQFVSSSTPDSVYFWNQGALMLAEYRWVGFAVAPLVFSIGALFYYVIFYRSRLIPRWLSWWGLLGGTLCAAWSMFVMFDLIGPFSTAQVLLALPIAVQEMVLALWLILKGFNPSVIASEPHVGS